jgi:flagellar assembly factor FliW
MSEQIDLAPYLGNESPPVEFPGGLIGFSEWTRFVLCTHPAGGPLHLLQSLEDERVSLIVADPAHILSGYRVSMSEADAHTIEYAGAADLSEPWPPDIAVYCILSVQDEPFTVTANLLGPLVINLSTGLGRQLVLSESGYDSRHPVTGHGGGTPC